MFNCVTGSCKDNNLLLDESGGFRVVCAKLRAFRVTSRDSRNKDKFRVNKYTTPERSHTLIDGTFCIVMRL